jgi:hypothetical protein
VDGVPQLRLGAYVCGRSSSGSRRWTEDDAAGGGAKDDADIGGKRYENNLMLVSSRPTIIELTSFQLISSLPHVCLANIRYSAS